MPVKYVENGFYLFINKFLTIFSQFLGSFLKIVKKIEK